MSPGDVSPVHRTRFVRVVVSDSRRGMGMPFAYSPEFRSMVVEQMRDGRSVAGLAPVGARNPVAAGQAAFWYSLMSPLQRVAGMI